MTFGPNEWLIDELYQDYLRDKDSVDPAWWEFFSGYRPAEVPRIRPATQIPEPVPEPVLEPPAEDPARAEPPGPPDDAPAGGLGPVASPEPSRNGRRPAPAREQEPDRAGHDHTGHDRRRTARDRRGPVSDRTAGFAPVAPLAVPAPDPLPSLAPQPRDIPGHKHEPAATGQTEVTRLRGPAARVVTNMESSLALPTATSVRSVPAKLLIDNRMMINDHLARARGGKISFTHLIGFALIEGLAQMPVMNQAYRPDDRGRPTLVRPAHVNLGIAIDIARPDGTRQLLVPNVKHVESMDFGRFWAAYENVIRRARNGKLTADDFADTTISLTNPGTIGTVHSVPRLMAGQGTIIGVGAMEHPAEYQGASADTIARLAVSKTVTLTSTYDHRIIQGAQSGEFLRIVHGKLLGEDGFYDRVFHALRIPYEPVRWVRDISVSHDDQINKTSRVHELIHAYRVRGHLMADTDPLEYRQRQHPDLDMTVHGLTLWDLEREFPTGGFGGRPVAQLRHLLGVLRDSYCRTIGVEYMHIQDPQQRSWIQSRIEHPYAKLSPDEQLRILRRLNAAEAFETFLQTKYVGQKRFSLEGGESVIPLLDELLCLSARRELDEVCIGMPHRGRLNVLANIAGKSYSQIFREFDGQQDPRSVQGSGDVKYHLGTEGVFTTPSGRSTRVYLAANPSHLEAVNPVLEGVVRAKQDRLNRGSAFFSVLPVLLHGDAAFAGQGVVAETLNLSQLRGYRTGGTVHVVINNQVGFTTAPSSSRSSAYCTDAARMIQAPIFHVNGDDPEACVRVARLAFEFRMAFDKDVVIDMVCYRRRGHNEGDDPSMTQPLMYSLIEAKRSVRKLYTEALIGRGDITVEEAEAALRDYKVQLERVFTETRDTAPDDDPQDRKGPEGPQDSGDVRGSGGVRDLGNVQGPGDVDVSGPGDTAAHPPQTAGLDLPLAQLSDAGQVAAGEDTAVPPEVLERIGESHVSPPEGFTVHPKLLPLLQRRADMVRHGGIDWGFAELLSLGSLLMEGVPVRMAGQDCRRGTFVQRHAVLTDKVTGAEWTPLAHLSEGQAKFWIYDSLLSEFAAMGFEYGYSVERPDALVLWEAQFGDFANGAQTIVDEFVSSSEQKWGQRTSVVLLLPHGYEGQGPDHSSGRIERYLQLCAENNMTVAIPSTPASHFHLLRRQAQARPRRPLVVFTPKSMLRMKTAASAVEDFTTGGFLTVVPDGSPPDPTRVDRVLLCSGKIYYELAAERLARGDDRTAIVRLEQLYPLDVPAILRAVAPYPTAQLVWVQEEPANQGAWSFIALNLPEHLAGRPLLRVSRPPSASAAVGSARIHQREQSTLLAQSFDR
ncbi:MAG: multifunctional 2-oxoglutarate metabolism enzyme [Actinomycetota bacterium]|nr:multifunctional 2-oxoglutarate metabolism enzyme [Actinomycetota bacterium]